MSAFKYIFFVLLLSITNLVVAQQFSWSEGIEKEGAATINKIISIENIGVYSFMKEGKSTYRIDFFSTDYKLQNTESNKVNGLINSVFRVGNNVCVFYSRFNTKTKRDELHYRVVGRGDEELLLSNGIKGGFHNHYIINVSREFSKIVVLTETPHGEGKKETLQINVFDQAFSLLRSKNYLIPGVYSQKRKVNVPLINDKGEVYILKKYKTKQQSKYFVITNRVSSTQISDFKTNHQILDANFTFTRSGELVIAGTYGRIMNKAEGLYVAKMDNNAGALLKKEYPFRMETMTAFVSEKSLKKNGLGLSGFRTKKLIEMKEGGAIVLEHHSRSKDKKTGKIIDDRKGFIIFYFNNKGDYFWDRPILVHQRDESYNGRWSSFVYYNDTVNNEIKVLCNQLTTGKKKGKEVQGKEILPSLITISSQGDFTVSSLETKIKEEVIDPKNYTNKKYGVVLVAQSLDNSLYRIGEVVFK